MQSLEQYGYFVTWKDASDDSVMTYLYELYMEPDPADAATLEIESTYNYNYIEVLGTADNGITYPFGTLKTFTPDTSFTQRFI